MAMVLQIPRGDSSVSLDMSDYNHIGFQGDPGRLGGAPLVIRCAAHWVGSKNFRVAEISITVDNPHPVWNFRNDNEGRMDGITFFREDGGPVLIGANIA